MKNDNLSKDATTECTASQLTLQTRAGKLQMWRKGVKIMIKKAVFLVILHILKG